MLLKTILNRIEPLKSFVYAQIRLVQTSEGTCIEITIQPRANGRVLCSCCAKPRPGYDRLPLRRFCYVPLWGIPVFFLYAMRRVNCPKSGVTVELVPWADGKEQTTRSFQWFLAHWAKRLAWSEVATAFRTTWQQVSHAVERAVAWGLEHRDLDGIEAIGVDEIQWQRGPSYLTLVYQIDESVKRLLWIAPERRKAALEGFFDLLGDERIQRLRYICSDMWQPYLKVIRSRASHALHILDRYHIMASMNKAIDKIRASEARQLVREGFEPVLKNSRWCLLKRRVNLSNRQTVKLKELLRYNLKSVRAYLLREDFQRFWQYTSRTWAEKFLNEWCTRTLRSRLGPMKKVARSMRRHQELILNWFDAHKQISAGVVEGLNNKVKLNMRKSYGFRSLKTVETVLYHTLGQLPEPEFTHEFW